MDGGARLLVLSWLSLMAMPLSAYTPDMITPRMAPVEPLTAADFVTPTARDYQPKGVVTPAEFMPASELQMTEYTFNLLGHPLVGTVEESAKIVVLVTSASAKARVESQWQQWGGLPQHLKAWVSTHNSIWYQDYGPIYARGSDGHLVSNDFTYNRSGRTQDDAVPAHLATLDGITNNPVGMNYEGGNFVSDGHGRCLASKKILTQNANLTRTQVEQLMAANLGCAELLLFEPLQDDYTLHIDLFIKLVGVDTAFVGDFVDHPENNRIMDANAQRLVDMGYHVQRLPVRSRGAKNYLTHINTFTINGWALVPEYGVAEDQDAKAAYEAAGFKVILIPAQDLENTGGAIHCILRSKPTLQD